MELKETRRCRGFSVGVLFVQGQILSKIKNKTQKFSRIETKGVPLHLTPRNGWLEKWSRG